MGRRQAVKPSNVVRAQSLAADFQSDPLDVTMLDKVGYSIICTGVTANIGEFGAQHRMDVSNDDAWVDLTLDTVPTLADADDNFLINLGRLEPGQVRVTFTGSGDGACDVFVSAASEGS